MENNNHKKRKVMLIAAFAVAVIALAGVGYAAVTGYKATTVNTDNTVTGVAFTAEQTGDYTGAFEADDLKVNTYTDATFNGVNTLYSVYTDSPEEFDTDGDTETNYYAAQIGSDLVITLSGDIGRDYDVSITATDGTNALVAPTGWVYIMDLNGKYVVLNGSGQGTISLDNVTVVSEEQTVTAKLYIGAEKAFETWEPTIDDLEDYVGCPTAKTSPLDERKLYEDITVVFTFEVTAALS